MDTKVAALRDEEIRNIFAQFKNATTRIRAHRKKQPQMDIEILGSYLDKSSRVHVYIESKKAYAIQRAWKVGTLEDVARDIYIVQHMVFEELKPNTFILEGQDIDEYSLVFSETEPDRVRDELKKPPLFYVFSREELLSQKAWGYETLTDITRALRLFYLGQDKALEGSKKTQRGTA